MTHHYDTSEDDFYKGIENASASVTDEVAYRLMAHLGFHGLQEHFGPLDEIRVADVGCYTGGSTIRWLKTGQALYTNSVVKVLGFDLHEETVAEARQNYPDQPHLFFARKDLADPMLLIDGQPYHLMFAPFVVETIEAFDEVQRLCTQMLDALAGNGELYFLRLHPDALTYADVFRDYHVPTRDTWTHGDSFKIRLAGQTEYMNDHFWKPEQIARLFSDQGCHVDLIPVGWDASDAIVDLLKGFIDATQLDADMPEWSVPLYQIIRVVKQKTSAI